MELEGLPFVSFHMLYNYFLENGLFLIPERCVLISEWGPLEVDTFMFGTVGRLDSVWARPIIDNCSNFLFHRGWNWPRLITRIIALGAGQCKQVSHHSNLQLSFHTPRNRSYAIFLFCEKQCNWTKNSFLRIPTQVAWPVPLGEGSRHRGYCVKVYLGFSCGTCKFSRSFGAAAPLWSAFGFINYSSFWKHLNLQ